MSSDRLRWLVDRALIGELLIGFARGLDPRDRDGYAEPHTEDGEPGPAIARGRAEISEFENGRRFTAVRVRPVWPAGEPLRH